MPPSRLRRIGSEMAETPAYPGPVFHVPTVTELMVPLTERDDRSVYFEDSFTSWSDHVRQSAAIAMKLRKRL